MCGSVRETNVRFHSAINYDADFKLGERVSEEELLFVGSEYEGNADLYCRDCLRKWTYDQLRAEYDVFAEFVEQDRLAMKSKESESSLSPDSIREQAISEVTGYEQSGFSAPVINAFGEFSFSWEGKAAPPCSDAWGGLLDAMEPIVTDRLRRRGWQKGRRITEDYKVFLDTDRRILAEPILDEP